MGDTHTHGYGYGVSMGIDIPSPGYLAVPGTSVPHTDCNVNCRLNAFVCRNINVWNRLPAHVVNSDSVAVFKRRLVCVNPVNFCFYDIY